MDLMSDVLVFIYSSFLLFTSTSAKEPSDVFVVVGGRAELPCRPKPDRADDKPMLLLWYRTNNQIPIYTYDTREGDFMAGQRWGDESVLGQRSYFVATSDPPKLVLEPVHASDQAVYTCRVDYYGSSSSTSIYVNLTVIVPPGPPQVLWEGRSVVGSVGPIKEGEKVKLTCRSLGGRPAPILTWLNGSRRLNFTTVNSTLDPVSGTFTTEVIVGIVATRQLLSSSITCDSRTPAHTHAEGVPGLQGRSSSVTLNITLPPLSVKILGSHSAVTEGTTLRLVCQSSGSHPPARLEWWRGDIPLHEVTYAIEDGGRVTTATMTILVNRLHDGATLTCTASNPALTSPPLSDKATLTVYYAPVVGLSLGRSMNPDLIKEDDDAYFECSIESNPPFQRIDWHQNGVQLVHNISAGVVMNGLNLVLRNLQREQSGSYTCTAANNEGRVTSNAVLLLVRHVPVCAGAKNEKTQGAARGSTAAVKCSVEAEPSSGIQWAWFRKRVDGSEEEMPQEYIRSNGLVSSVLVTPHTPDDYGRFLCLASNSVGSQQIACVVTLVPAGPPDTPRNCSINPMKLTAVTDTTVLTINCFEGFDGGLPQKFVMKAVQDGEIKANKTSDFPEWVVNGLQSGTSVSVTVFAYNARGESSALTMEVHTASAQQIINPGFLSPENETAVNISLIVGGTLGVVAVLLSLLIVGIVFCKKRRPQLHKPIPAEVPLTPTSPADDFDPDVVTCGQRHVSCIDVIPSDQKRNEESCEQVRFITVCDEGLLQERASRQSSGHTHRKAAKNSHRHSGQSLYIQSEGEEYSCMHTLGSRMSRRETESEYIRDGQDTLTHDSQSYDSGVSESESDTELQIMANDNVAAVIRQYPDSGRAYIKLSPRTALPSVTSDAEVHLITAGTVDVPSRLGSSLEAEPTSKPTVEVKLKPFVSKEYKVLTDDGESLHLLPSPSKEVRLVHASAGDSRSFRETLEDIQVLSSKDWVNEAKISHRSSKPSSNCAVRSPTTQTEVICLPISPGEYSSSNTLPKKISREATLKQTRSRTSSSRSSPVLSVGKELSAYDFEPSQKQLGLENPDTLLHSKHGELVYIPCKSFLNKDKQRSFQGTPIFPNMQVCDTVPPLLTETLPKAYVKERRKKAIKQAKSQDFSERFSLDVNTKIEADSRSKLCSQARRSYQPQLHPDVCRRESSV